MEKGREAGVRERPLTAYLLMYFLSCVNIFPIKTFKNKMITFSYLFFFLLEIEPAFYYEIITYLWIID